MFGIHTYTGGAIYTPENHYEKIDFSDMRDQALQRANVKGGWVAMVEHYSLAPGSRPRTRPTLSTAVTRIPLIITTSV